MRVWRLKRKAHATDLTGVGGLRVSGRWHHRGHAVLYTSEAASLAVLEFLVHVDPADLPDDLRMVEIDVPNRTSIERCDPTTLAKAWQKIPGPTPLQDFGSEWLASRRTAALRVPSAVVPMQFNYVLNPEHSDAKRFRVVTNVPFSFDPRLLT